ncbi:probable serine/threonine-protein kinase SIS8 isoform X1 [Populus alba]|uniref:non-specific serine/threonine protein kinase n=3 Tax=Populus TaxID=3689 RepID=A0A4U5QKP7_POPAL|nr:probable serine/threonine-protein kinase SIS8 isoform X1 [Populus alba]KAJ6970018.1 serine/threonine-protein kinase SIS8 isoform X1 [Populus alba x Populus x berolinensis]TKS11273.1 serine/threonine-protein kinase EDR1 isoform X1 [Populus alba]
MKNFLKKLHIMPNQLEDAEGSNSSRGHKSTNGSSPDNKSLHSRSQENKPFSGLSNWLSSVANRKSPSPPSSSNVTRGEKVEQPESISSSGFDVVSEAARRDSGSTTSRDPDVEEEYQIQLALELSASEDPEAVQIEAVKQISLGSCAPENTPAEVIAYRYWNYNALSYDDKVLDGFYDLYGIMTESTTDRMPPLVDLQGTRVSDGVTWEAVLVNRAADANLLKLEQKALEMTVKSRSECQIFIGSALVGRLAVLVSEYMGGSVGDPSNLSRAWRSLSYSLKATLGSMVLPLGSLTIGLPRHRALMFKVLADSVGIPCRLVKGHLYTGSDDVAMNFVKLDDGREYIVDLTADPGTLIPSDAAGSHIEYDETFFSSSPLSRDIDSSHIASSSSGHASSFEEHSELGTLEKQSRLRNIAAVGNQSDGRSESHEGASLTRPSKSGEESTMSSDDFGKTSNAEKVPVRELPGRPIYPYAHARSPSWTEGVSSPAARRMKVKDVSQYMIDAAKENPHLAQKLHDVLLESGVVAPPNLFTEIYAEQLDFSTAETKSPTEDKVDHKQRTEIRSVKDQDDLVPARFLPPLPPHRLPYKASSPGNPPDQSKPVEGSGVNHPFDTREITGLPIPLQSEVTPMKYVKKVPVAAAAAAAAAVVASSMVVAAAKSGTDSNLELPVAAAATATAAAVVATTAAVNKQYEQGARSDGDADNAGYEPRGSGDKGSGGRSSEGHGSGSGGHGSGGQECDALGANSEGERISDRSVGNDSSKSDAAMDDVAECEIPWDEISLGERIGLGSYGEVYRGDWHGTEVAVKRFLDQDITGESLAEFRSEVRIMKRVRHPNVVLFMGAVTRAPNLSIVTEFLPRGSLYRLLHRPNNQLDERRRLRMAFDAARGMNYLHNCTPMIVHRDLKSPNLLVDKNWVVKVCDFGLSRMKHSTFLSSRSTAGTAEWMAPEVLRNEPSDEKCDVYSFGVILWELSTLQQPWGGMNPMQVVGAVGFQHRRLDIPNDMDPAIADIIRNCWKTDPKLRPTFTEIMAALKPLQKPVTGPQVPRPNASLRSGREKVQLSQEAEDRAG